MFDVHVVVVSGVVAYYIHMGGADHDVGGNKGCVASGVLENSEQLEP